MGVLETGVHRGNPQANVIVSDWGWRGHGEASDIVARLPQSVWLMSVSEWNLPIERGGIATKVGEYSISAVGPGPRSVRHWAAAKQAGLKTAAEIQFNNTCEIASIPYIPVMDLVAEHIHNLVPSQLDGMLIGWTMGGHPSPNFELARELNRTPAPNVETVLETLARERFGVDGAVHARKAWTLMSDAYREYPFHISVVYTSPVQWGPANPVYPVSTGYSATMWGIPYDHLNGWRGPYPPEVFAAQFEKMAAQWRPGVAELQLAVDQTPPDRVSEARTDLRFARAAGFYFQAVANQSRFVLARDALADASVTRSPDERRRLRADMQRCLESEITLAASSTHWYKRTRGSDSSRLASISFCRWTSSKKSSTAAGSWSICRNSCVRTQKISQSDLRRSSLTTGVTRPRSSSSMRSIAGRSRKGARGSLPKNVAHHWPCLSLKNIL